jgi:hypothetical protein
LRKVGGLSPNTLHNVSGFSLPPIKTDHHHITEKLLSMAINDKQTVADLEEGPRTISATNLQNKVILQIYSLIFTFAIHCPVSSYITL